jgi:hypothetical protein
MTVDLGVFKVQLDEVALPRAQNAGFCSYRARVHFCQHETIQSLNTFDADENNLTSCGCWSLSCECGLIVDEVPGARLCMRRTLISLKTSLATLYYLSSLSSSYFSLCNRSCFSFVSPDPRDRFLKSKFGGSSTRYSWGLILTSVVTLKAVRTWNAQHWELTTVM